MEEITLKMNSLLSQVNVFSVKGVREALLISLNCWKSCARTRIYFWTGVYLSRILRSAHLLSVSPRASHSKAFKSMRTGQMW